MYLNCRCGMHLVTTWIYMSNREYPPCILVLGRRTACLYSHYPAVSWIRIRHPLIGSTWLHFVMSQKCKKESFKRVIARTPAFFVLSHHGPSDDQKRESLVGCDVIRQLYLKFLTHACVWANGFSGF